MTKPFDASLHNLFDPLAKRVALRYLNMGKASHHYDYVTVNPDKYGIDLLAIKDEKTVFGIELEVKTSWKNDFPFKSVNLPARKQKFFSLDSDPSNFFIIFNSTLDKLLIIRDDDIHFSMLKNCANRFMETEQFFQVPLKFVEFRSI